MNLVTIVLWIFGAWIAAKLLAPVFNVVKD